MLSFLKWSLCETDAKDQGKAEAMGTEKASKLQKFDNGLYHHPGGENLAFPNITAIGKTVNRELQPKSRMHMAGGSNPWALPKYTLAKASGMTPNWADKYGSLGFFQWTEILWL